MKNFLPMSFLLVLFFPIGQALAGDGFIEGFTGAFAQENWTIELPDPTYGGEVSWDGTHTLIIEGPDGSSCSGGREVLASIAVPFGGRVAFDWEYTSTDVGTWDFFIVLIDADGQEHQIVYVDNADAPTSGSVNRYMGSGETLVLTVGSVDCILGPGIATISSFSFGTPPIPLAIWVLPASLLMMAVAKIRFF